MRDLDRRTVLRGLGASVALGTLGLPTAQAGVTDAIQRSLFMEMASAYALNGDKKAFRSLFRVQNTIRQLGAWPGARQIVEVAMESMSRVLKGLPVERPGFRAVKRIDSERVVVFSDHHILPDDNRQSEVWRTNRDGYTRVLRHYGSDGWTVVENGDIEDLVILEPDTTVSMYNEALGSNRFGKVRRGDTRTIVEQFRNEPEELVEALKNARRPRRQEQFTKILNSPGNAGYYGVLRELAATDQLVRIAGNHDYDLQQLDASEAHLVPVDVAIVDRAMPYAILHGHQFDQATAPGVAPLYGEVISECLGVWFQGPDRTWGAREVNRILHGGFPNRLSTHGHGDGQPNGSLVGAMLLSRDKADASWAAAWEKLFGHAIAWEYGSRDWRQGVVHGLVRPGDLIDQAMLGRQFFKFRHLDEAEVVYGLERWRLDIGLVLGHSHEVRAIQAGPVGRYYNSGAAGRFSNLLWAVEMGPEGEEVVAWHIEPDGSCQRYTFELVQSAMFSYFETQRSHTRVTA